VRESNRPSVCSCVHVLCAGITWFCYFEHRKEGSTALGIMFRVERVTN
jgi:hypothetical protein